MDDKDKFFSLVLQAEKIQEYTRNFVQDLAQEQKEALKTLVEGSKTVLRDSAREILTEEAKNFSGGISEALEGMRKAGRELAYTAGSQRWFSRVQTGLLIASFLAFVGWGYVALKTRPMGEEWGIRLITTRDGKRYIQLKKGDTPGQIVNWESGEVGIEVLP